jgi:hypothetical protein
MRHHPYTYLFSALKASSSAGINQNLALLHVWNKADLNRLAEQA